MPPHSGEVPQISDEERLDHIFDDLFATAGGVTLPKYRFPEQQHNADRVKVLVQDELLLDGNASQNFATFRRTSAEDELHERVRVCTDKNMIDKDERPQTAEI